MHTSINEHLNGMKNISRITGAQSSSHTQVLLIGATSFFDQST